MINGSNSMIFTNKDVKKGAKIEIHLVGDADIKKINKESRNKDYPTDVLSIEMDENTPDGIYYIGDILINIDQAKRQMKDYDNQDVRLEIAELAAHGVLHLLGVHHDEYH